VTYIALCADPETNKSRRDPFTLFKKFLRENIDTENYPALRLTG